MTRNGHTHFLVHHGIQLCRQSVGHRWVVHRSPRFCELLLGHLRFFLADGTFGHCDDGEALAFTSTITQSVLDGIEIVGDLRQKNNVSAPGYPGMQCKPAGLMTHELNNKYAAVGSCCGVNTVDDICSNVNRALETEGHFGTPKIIVNCFWQRNNIQTLLRKLVGCFMCSVAPQNYETIQTLHAIVAHHGVILGLFSIRVQRVVHFFEWLTRSPEHRSAQGQDA